MPTAKKLLAFDLGAESGRGVLGLFDGQRLTLEVIHRFPTGSVRTQLTRSQRSAALKRSAKPGMPLSGMPADSHQ